MGRRAIVCAAVLALGSTLGSGLGSATSQGARFLGFELLNLDGALVKWRGEFGKPVQVTYAFVTEPTSSDTARNCRTMVPADRLLRRSGIAADVFRREVRAAFDMWESAAQIRFVETKDAGRAGILIGAQGAPTGRAFADVAYRPEPRAVRDIERSLICLNPAVPWKVGFDGNTGIYDVRYTVAHEIGHAIGLDHAGRSGQLMSFRYHEEFRGLQPGDIAGAARLYGARRPAATDTARYARSPRG